MDSKGACADESVYGSQKRKALRPINDNNHFKWCLP